MPNEKWIFAILLIDSGRLNAFFSHKKLYMIRFPLEYLLKK